MARKAPARTNYRSAKSGLFVTKDYAKHHPATTVREHNLVHAESGLLHADRRDDEDRMRIDFGHAMQSWFPYLFVPGMLWLGMLKWAAR